MLIIAKFYSQISRCPRFDLGAGVCIFLRAAIACGQPDFSIYPRPSESRAQDLTRLR